MERRGLWAVVSGAVGLLLVLAATAGPVRLWSIEDDSPLRTRPVNTVPSTDSDQRVPVPTFEPIVRDAGDNVLMQILGVIVGILIIAALVQAARNWRRIRLPQLRRRRPPELVAEAPDTEVTTLTVDAVAARAALLGGTPRNAIVACWMQLERDAAEAGLPRREAETSAEYVERVVATASVDRAPIAELAALFREARFSRHELGDAHRAAAVDALDRVLAALPRTVEAGA